MGGTILFRVFSYNALSLLRSPFSCSHSTSVFGLCPNSGFGEHTRPGCGWTPLAPSPFAPGAARTFGILSCARGFPRGRGKQHAGGACAPVSTSVFGFKVLLLGRSSTLGLPIGRQLITLLWHGNVEEQNAGHPCLWRAIQQLISQRILDSSGMNLLTPSRRFDPNYPELIDRDGTDQAWLRQELHVLESTNRRLGGHQLVVRYVEQLLESRRMTSLSILDLGTGIADIPRAIVAWSRRRSVSITVLAVDGNPVVLEIARESCRDWPEIKLEQHDLLALPYAPESFDLVLCSLTLHHFSSANAVEILRRIHDLARLGYIVNDLRRNWLAICSIELLARTVIRSDIVRHDAPQSSRAAFTIDELRAMASQAGLTNFRINRHQAGFRMVLVGRK